MPFHNPTPDAKAREQSQPKDSGGLKSLAQAERLMQIALVLPCGMVLGWGLGWWIDHHFHSHWATITGVIVGISAGMVGAIRMGLAAGNAADTRSGK
jgi:ATP synthase protein I